MARKHWKTYAADSGGVTVTSEAAAQTVSVSTGTLAYVGDAVEVFVNGETVGTSPQSLTLTAGDTVTATGGTCVFRVSTTHEFADDGSDVFYGLNWACVGDSIMSIQGTATTNNASQAVKAWEMLSGQYASFREDYVADSVTNNMKRPYLATGINCYSGKSTSGEWLAQGSTGYWRNAPFYKRLQNLPHDCDIVTIYGSINDWTYRSSGSSGDSTFGAGSEVRGKYLTNTNMATWYDSLLYAEDIMRSDGADIDSLNTFAKYVLKAISVAHEQAPLAKIVLVDPIFYNVSGSALGSRNYIDIPAVRKLTVDDFIRVNAPEWLTHCAWGLQPKADYNSDNSRWTLVASSRAAWLDDDSILVDGETLAAQKMISDTAFAQKYVSDYSSTSGASYGHVNTLYNELYFAPKFANLICDTLNINGYYLPDGLKCNNLSYEAPDGGTSYSITTSLANCIASPSNPTTISVNGSVNLQFTANTGYTLPSTIIISGATYSWNATTGALVLSNPTGNVTVSIAAIKESTSTGSNIPIYTASGTQISGLDELWTHSGAHPTHIYNKYCVEIIFG